MEPLNMNQKDLFWCLVVILSSVQIVSSIPLDKEYNTFDIECGNDINSDMNITYYGDAFSVYANDHQDTCALVQNEPTIYFRAIDSSQRQDCGVVQAGLAEAFFFEIVIQETNIRKITDEVFVITCNYEMQQGDITDYDFFSANEDVGRLIPNVNLVVVSESGSPVRDSVLGDRIRLEASFTIPGLGLGLKAWNCFAHSGEKKPEAMYRILGAGCGDGDIIDDTVGFTSVGDYSHSPWFEVFALPHSNSLQFKCEFIICAKIETCQGTSCVINGKQKRSLMNGEAFLRNETPKSDQSSETFKVKASSADVRDESPTLMTRRNYTRLWNKVSGTAIKKKKPSRKGVFPIPVLITVAFFCCLLMVILIIAMVMFRRFRKRVITPLKKEIKHRRHIRQRRVTRFALPRIGEVYQVNPDMEMSRKNKTPGFTFWPRFWYHNPGTMDDLYVKEPKKHVSVIEKTMYFDEEDEDTSSKHRSQDVLKNQSGPSESSWFVEEDSISVIDTTVGKFPRPKSRSSSTPRSKSGDIKTIHPPRHDDVHGACAVKAQSYTPTLPTISDDDQALQRHRQCMEELSKRMPQSQAKNRQLQYEQNWSMLSPFSKPNLMY